METRSSSQASRFRLDRERYQLLDGGSPVRLERQPMELLFLLAQRRGQLVTREEIAAALWADGVFVDTDRNINSIVRKLRQALKDDPDHPQFLETVVGKGYRFVGPLEVTPNGTEPGPPTAVPERPAAMPAPSSTVPWKPAFAVVAVVAVAVIVWLGVRSLRSSGIEASSVRTIAVLPLEDVSGDASQEYFAEWHDAGVDV